MDVSLSILDSEQIQRQFAAGIQELEIEAGKQRYNALCIKALAEVAKLLNQDTISARASSILNEMPDEAILKHSISNFPPPNDLGLKFRTLKSKETLEKNYPPYSLEKLQTEITALAKSEEHIALCLSGQLDSARRKAQSGLMLQDIAATLAVLGDLNSAAQIAADPKLSTPRKSVFKWCWHLSSSGAGTPSYRRAFSPRWKREASTHGTG